MQHKADTNELRHLRQELWALSFQGAHLKKRKDGVGGAHFGLKEAPTSLQSLPILRLSAWHAGSALGVCAMSYPSECCYLTIWGIYNK